MGYRKISKDVGSFFFLLIHIASKTNKNAKRKNEKLSGRNRPETRLRVLHVPAAPATHRAPCATVGLSSRLFAPPLHSPHNCPTQENYNCTQDCLRHTKCLSRDLSTSKSCSIRIQHDEIPPSTSSRTRITQEKAKHPQCNLFPTQRSAIPLLCVARAYSCDHCSLPPTSVLYSRGT